MKWFAISVLALVFILGVAFKGEVEQVLSGTDSKSDGNAQVTPSGRTGSGEKAERTVEELLLALLQAEDRWNSSGVHFEDLEGLRRRMLGAWSAVEVEKLARSGEAYGWESALFERWGEDDHRGAIEYLIEQQETAAEELKRRREADEVGVGRDDFVTEGIGMSLNAVLAGWSNKDAKAAWLAIRRDEMGLTKIGGFFSNYGYLAPIQIFENLSKLDSEFALSEFEQYPKSSFRGSMLKGMARGLPKGSNWQTLFERVIESPNSENRDIVAVLRGGLLGRWMEDDANAAVEWFQSDAGKVISKELVEVFEGEGGDPFASGNPEPESRMVEREIPVSGAVRHWLARDVPAASRWLQDHQGMIPEVLETGSWLDEDQASGKDLRLMLVLSLDQQGREEALRAVKGTAALGNVFESQNEEGLKREIAELQLTPEFARGLFELKVESDADPFADPFADE